jgi:dTDP-4-dehydrorhamnose 3,5-epimerase-like enzyme
MTSIQSCKIIPLPRNNDPRGNLTVVENNINIPFEARRVFWIYDVPGGEYRGGHAMKSTSEFIIALSGSFDVIIDDGVNKVTYSMNRSYYGLLLPNLIWRQMVNFSTNAVALVFASTEFDPDDYVYHYDDFLRIKMDQHEQH